MSLTRSFELPERVDLRLTLEPLRSGGWDPRMKVTSGSAARASFTPEGPATLHLQVTGCSVEATAWGPGANWALDTAPELLGAADRPEDFQPSDPTMTELARSARGLRLIRSYSVYDVLIPTILEQKVTTIEAHRSLSGLVRRYGEPAPGPLGLWLLPEPEVLAALPYFEFHPLGVERRRAEAIRTAARLTGRLEEVTGMDTASACKRLMAVAGIGAWTTATVVCAVLGAPDVVITGDYHFPNLTAWALAGEPRADDPRMLELLEPYRGQRGRALRYITASGPRAPKFGPKKRLRDLARI